MAKIILKLVKAATSMQQGTIQDWKVSNGDHVIVGQILYEVETEKSTIEIDSPFEGVITILEKAGIPLAVGHPIAQIQT